MKKIYNNIFSFVKSHKVISAFILIAAIGLAIFGYGAVFGGKSTTQYVIGKVTKGDLVLTVNGTGQVSAESQVDLKPQGTTQSASTITEVDVKQGDAVSKNQLIAVVDNASALIALNQAKANVESAQASYDKVINGTTPENIQTSKDSVTSAQQDLDNQYSGAISTLNSAQAAMYNAYNVLLGFQNEYFTSADPQGIQFQNSKNDINTQIQSVQGYVDIARKSMAPADIDTFISQTISAVNSAYNDVVTARAQFDSGIYYYKVADADKTSLDTQKTNINTSLSSVTSLQHNIASSKIALQKAKDSLSVTTAPATQTDITVAQASLDNSKASLQSAQNSYDKNFLRAPFNGVIAAVNVSPGDVVDTNTVVATIITKQQVAKISLNEVDAASVKIGDPATITFSALPDVTATGTVEQIDTIGTVTSGVVSYNAKILIDVANPDIKPGMSVSAKISVGKDSNVLLVPNSAVSTVGSNSTVQLLNGVPNAKDGATITLSTSPKTTKVQVGDSDNANTVITSGLKEGDLIVTHTVTGAAAKSKGGLFSPPGGGN